MEFATGMIGLVVVFQVFAVERLRKEGRQLVRRLEQLERKLESSESPVDQAAAQ